MSYTEPEGRYSYENVWRDDVDVRDESDSCTHSRANYEMILPPAESAALAEIYGDPIGTLDS